MRKSFIAMAGVVLTLAITSAAFAQHAIGGGTAAAADQFSTGSGMFVVDWNKALVTIVNTPGAQPATIHPTRSFAILHSAIYDAVNAIEGTHKPYLVRLSASHFASQEAATAAAAHESS